MRVTIFGRRLPAVAFDVALAGLVALVSVGGGPVQPGGWWSAAIGVAMAAALLFRRARPVTVTAVVAVLAFAQVALGWAPMLYDVAVLIALYSVVAYGERLRDGAVAGAVALVGAVFAAVRDPLPTAWYYGAIYYTLLTGAVWLVALNVRTRRQYVLSLEERAATLERERQAEARAAVAEERTRIARELHDVVAHSMAVMIVQADGARYMIDQNPETSRDALTIVADTGRQALEDMRRLVGVLREPSPPEPVAASPERPARDLAEATHRRPSVADLPALLDRFREAGLRVRYTVTGVPVPLPPALELTVHRLAQEALTNVLKHAGVGASVEITLEHTPGGVALVVVDDGRGHAPLTLTPSGGHGLVGMRERTSVYDGSLTAGARLAGGWQVRAWLPLPSSPGTEAIAA